MTAPTLGECASAREAGDDEAGAEGNVFVIGGNRVDLRDEVVYRRKNDNGPDFDEADLISMDDLAAKTEKSIPTIRNLMTRGLPCFVEGGPGKPYWFYLPDVADWFRREEARAQKRRAERDKRASDQLAFILNDDAIAGGAGGLSMEERRKAFDTELKYMQAAKQRGELVKAGDLKLQFTRVFAGIRERLRQLPDNLQSRFGLEDEVVDAAERVVDDALEKAYLEIVEIVQPQQQKEAS